MVYYETLQTANILKNHYLATSISDTGRSAFLTLIAFKAACADRQVVAVNPAFTSQICSGCGPLVQQVPSMRWHACPACATCLHRDHNAANNIERLGQCRRGGVMIVAS